MSFWGGVRGFFGGGQDGQSNVMKVASGIGNWIDKGKFTEQEKAEHSARMIVHYSNYMESTVAENTERSRTRRDIALWIIKTEVFLLLTSVVVFKFDPALSEYIYRVATESPMGYLTLGVGAFFFGAHLVRAAKQ